ncbi:sterigmatocystin 8-O-methyltransferase [Periconia macrospinosa]|uniref:Sterigmatocystin 8-O-methyltransferase n=1 Tax=Periconia macrospinosa TaxID=97972 RepID=A0A2V1DZL0_9PLEO|nr:sterigmatocystin 8-O-methyltransferase [Periconia macrospinosa]
MDELPDLLKSIQAVDTNEILFDAAAKKELLHVAKKLTAVLEGPVNRATDLVFKPYTTIAARIAVDLNLFHHISSAPGGTTSKQLADLTGADELLISRILRLLASTSFVDELGEDEWGANATTQALATPPIAAGHRFVYDALIASAIKAPKFLAETHYAVPTQPTDTFIQYTNQTRLLFFEYLASMPSMMRDFNLFMGNTMGDREYWHEWYDVRGRLIDGFDEERSPVLVVDVGGGKGHDLQAFWRAFGGDEGYVGKGGGERRLVLQDLQNVLDGIGEGEVEAGIVKMEHDFFTEQPVKGARGYFLHHILHDWSDEYCLKILRRLRDAMVPGYSKLLIHELILPNTGAAEIQARFDLVMMTLNGGMERSRSQWIKLLEDAGFSNIQIHEHLDHDGVVEAEVPIA